MQRSVHYNNDSEMARKGPLKHPSRAQLFLWFTLGLVLALGSQRTAAQTISKSKTAQISFLISRLDSLQVKSDPVFLTGSYPSYIHHRRHFKEKHKDITIFFNILIDLTLKSVRPGLPDSLQIKIDTLVNRSKRIYPRFYNKQRGTFNFWLRDSAYKFPYSWWIPLIKKDGAVPDDMDDSVLARFIWGNAHRDSLKRLHQVMQSFTHQPDRKLRTAPPAYRQYPTYSTWFGKKFPVVLDAVVLSNILSFVTHYNLAWTSADSAALRLIVHTITSEDYINHPQSISPYYGKTAILLYHYARLMQQAPLAALDSLRPELIKTANNLLHSSKDLMEKVITANALAALGQHPPALALPPPHQWKQQIENSDFAYFIGNIPSYMPRSLQQILTNLNAMMYYHYCPAFNDALVLQYLCGLP